MTVVRQGPSGAERVGQGEMRGQSTAAELAPDVSDQCLFAVKQAGQARHVEEQAFRRLQRIDAHRGTELLAPRHLALKRLAIAQLKLLRNDDAPLPGPVG